MIKFILILIGLFIIMTKPFLIVLAGVALLTWLFLKRPDSFLSLPAHLTTPEPEEEPTVEKDFITAEERTEKEMSKIKFKEGYQDDPKWKALNKKVMDHNARQAGITVKLDRLEELTNEVI